MKKVAFTILLSLAMAGQLLRADATWIYSVQLDARVETSPAKITLRWQPDTYGANSYTVYRKGINDNQWGRGIALPGSATNYVDADVEVGAAYEYQVVKAGSLGYTGYGYIFAGVERFFTENRGKVILMVDNTVADDLAQELNRLHWDLVGDGWSVVRRNVSRSDSPAAVKNVITAEYRADPGNVRAVFLFGHVPILRCGNLNADGHQARPMPADAYYGDMDGTWDNPDYLPSDVELMVGRVDLANMPGKDAPAPWPNETELLRNYLNKDHRWRHKQLDVPSRALVGNRFGDRDGEAFAASGFRNFPPLVGWENMFASNDQDGAPEDQRWSSMLAANPFLWAYGCGGGSYTSMSGMGTHGAYGDVTSYDIVGQDAKAVFFMMFGSWLGEWDSPDNIMRAALATPSLGLTCSWAGRPHWFYHHMALGEPIGFSARLTMNNGGLYQNQVNYCMRGIHIALMGDPTLRMHPVAPPSNVSVSPAGSGVNLSWSASSDNVVGYHVYRAGSPNGPFTRLNNSFIKDTSFSDPSGSGNATYMVRAVKVQDTPSGTYWNPSQGAFAYGSAQ